MTATVLMETALLLGLYVALAGSYGLSYAIARLRGAARFPLVPLMIYALHIATAILIVAWSPLQAGWKGLLVASSAAFLAIPPITWRFLEHTHQTEYEDDRKRRNGIDRALALLPDDLFDSGGRDE
jgi:hypothetical protein